MIHSYPWYISDWRGSEKRLRMSLEEKAVYRELLDHCWEHGSLPNDEKILAKISTATPSEFRRVWPVVKSAFLVDGDRLLHEKVQAKRPEVMRLAEQRREAGRKSAEARAERARQRSLNESSNARSTSVQAQLQPSSTITSTSTSITTTPTPSSSPRSQEKPVAVAPGKMAFSKPTAGEVEEYARSIGFPLDGEEFVAYYEQRGWRPGSSRTQMKDWRAAVVTWKKTWQKRNQERAQASGIAETTKFVPKVRYHDSDQVPDDEIMNLFANGGEA